ncbi:Response regulator receiver domain-containing protein [Salinihabitans flavidus]|uniref:Response regulator receiver domain-containing protein n=1 Tax=Salinihabitans flavidus TaxID=569882 RepID=A0A1H8QRT4_9RHOB|nr:response regulator [Salinihabitans flavidus]SEO56707.1 Response regulator receiver domain-containing protein [Salinihabitans flavidus]
MTDPILYSNPQAPTAARPLLGLTVLVVEDSRFACEALRLMCLRSGARIRRADCLRSARRHLQVYRPSVVIIDLGLPDGSGADLIDELSHATPRVEVILGMSGDDFSEPVAIAAGADGFLGKPLKSLASFQEAILIHLPHDRRPSGPRIVSQEDIRPDPIAYRDDMAHLADVLGDSDDSAVVDYVAQFATSVARSAGDAPLEAAGSALRTARRQGQPAQSALAHIAGIVQSRLTDSVAI